MSGTESNKAVFTQGSTMRHVVVMTATGALGLLSIFAVDVINLFYISLLGEQELAAAVGYAATLMFFTISICIGFSIATVAITAKAIGAGDDAAARKNAGTSLIFMTVIGVVVFVAAYLTLPYAIGLLGAEGRTFDLTLHFMQIALLSFPLMALSMCASFLLRAKGDAKRAMYVTLSAGATALVVDPLLILGFGWGLTGAAIAIGLARIVMLLVAFHGVFIVHKMVELPSIEWMAKTLRPFMAIAIPAVLTQIATPFGNAYVTAAISEFGDSAVAGWAIVGRLYPLSFAAIFSLSGAIGPILSQNLGAGRLDRVNMSMRDALKFTLAYSLVVWAILALASPWIGHLFNATGEAYDLVAFFCVYVAGSLIFTGTLFVANAAFNNLGFPVYSTVFNWGRATLGTIPFVMVGAYWGAEGVLAAWGLGSIVFGVLAMVFCFRAIATIKLDHVDDTGPVPVIPAANSPFTSGKGSV